MLLSQAISKGYVTHKSKDRLESVEVTQSIQLLDRRYRDILTVLEEIPPEFDNKLDIEHTDSMLKRSLSAKPPRNQASDDERTVKPARSGTGATAMALCRPLSSEGLSEKYRWIERKAFQERSAKWLTNEQFRKELRGFGVRIDRVCSQEVH